MPTAESKYARIRTHKPTNPQACPPVFKWQNKVNRMYTELGLTNMFIIWIKTKRYSEPMPLRLRRWCEKHFDKPTRDEAHKLAQDYWATGKLPEA